MRIAYSCAGEGFGHAARMVALYGDLSSRHQVELFVPPDVDAFVRARLPTSNPRSLPFFTLVKDGNAIRYFETSIRAIATYASLPLKLHALAHTLRRLQIDVVLSDYEPVLPMAARLARIPVVQMNHPGIVSRFPDPSFDRWAACLSSKLMQGPWDRRVFVSFYGGDVGPLLRPALLREIVRDEGFLAVNVKGEVRAAIVPVLDAIPGLRYRLYPSPGANFDEGLARCSAVLTSAGHQTISEALVLGKPVLCFPQEGQYEQLLNARMLRSSSRGDWCALSDLSSVLPEFWGNLDRYRSPRIHSPLFKVTDSRLALLALLEQHFDDLTSKRPGRLEAWLQERRVG